MALILALAASGCGSDPETRRETLGGLATTSALVAAMPLMPLIPFTAGYTAISESKERKSDKLLYQQLDPVYQKRIEMIQARSPEADAATAWAQGSRAYLPSVPNVGYYPGLDPSVYHFGRIEGNQEQIDHSEFLTYLQTLMTDDPLQAQVHSFNDTFNKFLSTRHAYQEAFNREMFRRMNGTNAAAK